MQTFRAYTLDLAGRITWGQWIQAQDLEEARRKAHEMCDGGHPVVELWRGREKLEEIACDDGRPPIAGGSRRNPAKR